MPGGKKIDLNKFGISGHPGKRGFFIKGSFWDFNALIFTMIFFQVIEDHCVMKYFQNYLAMDLFHPASICPSLICKEYS